jgi:phenylalanyl-tRNA synthetase beta chain
VVSEVADVRAETYEHEHFPFDPVKTVQRIGADIPEKEMLEILKRLGFEAEKKTRGMYDMDVPYWRDHDIETSVDFVEEIARVYGYANIPSALPAGELRLVPEDPGLVWERRAKEALRGAGFTEAYAYSFISRKQLESYGIDPVLAVHVQNPLSSEQEFLRTSLLPTMLTTVEANQRAFSEE